MFAATIALNLSRLRRSIRHREDRMRRRIVMESPLHWSTALFAREVAAAGSVGDYGERAEVVDALGQRQQA